MNTDPIYIFKHTKLTKNNFSDYTYIFPAVIANIIFSKTIFKHNDDIKYLTNDMLSLNYLDYVFAARPYLFSRIIKDLYINDSNIFRNMIIIQQFINSLDKEIINKNYPKGKLKNKSQSEIINEWSKLINPDT